MKSERREQSGWVTIQISGSLDENVSLDELLGPPVLAPSKMAIHCGGVTRVNSVGVKEWLRYFGAAAKQGAQLSFHEASVAVVEQINLIPKFLAGGELVSFFAPFLCQQCSETSNVLFDVKSFAISGFAVPDRACPKCGGRCLFDEIADEYFLYVKQSRRS
jgi:anti-anti-sigma regulatory factor